MRSQPPSRPSTPLRPSSRTSLRNSQTSFLGIGSSAFPLEPQEPAFAELSDSMADLEANFMHLQLMHESLARFNENFASFLYGMNMNAFCVDFPEVESFFIKQNFYIRIMTTYWMGQAPISDSFKKARRKEDHNRPPDQSSRPDFGEETFMTTDTSFVENPPSSRARTRFATPTNVSRSSTELNKRGGREISTQGKGGPARANMEGVRTSGIARGKPRGTRFFR